MPVRSDSPASHHHKLEAVNQCGYGEGLCTLVYMVAWELSDTVVPFAQAVAGCQGLQWFSCNSSSWPANNTTGSIVK
jgi:hypothetical protein